MVDLKAFAKVLRKTLKATYPDHKFSVTCEFYTGGQRLNVALMAAPESPFATLHTLSKLDPPLPDHDGTHRQLNPHYIKQDWDGHWISNGAHLTEKAANLLIEVVELANAPNYDNSDRMTDYFDVGYYLHLDIGKWNKPFTVTQ